MNALDPRTPVLVGTAQQNVTDGDAEPIELMVRMAQKALADTGAAAALAPKIGSLRTVKGIWPYTDPAHLVREQLGMRQAETSMAPQGGNWFYDVAGMTASSIQSGELDAAIIFSAETMRTRRRDKKAGRTTAYLQERPDAAPERSVGAEMRMSNDVESAALVNWPINFYAMADTALRHRNGETPAEHLIRISELWSIGADVASLNPHAAITSGVDAAEIATPSDSNRMIASPYPKLMTSNINVDQGAAVVMCSVAVAEAAGVPRDRWVFPMAGAGANDTRFTTSRWELDASAPMRIAGQRAMELAGVNTDDIGLLDLYSCFPAAVQVAQRELGISADRPWTITGGLTFAGGPMNAYCLHALATAVDLLREADNETALLTGNGGYFTKQSVMVLGSEPPANPFRYERPQAEVDALGARTEATSVPATGTVETYTLSYGRSDSPEVAIVSVMSERGERTYAHTRHADTMAELGANDMCGVEVRLEATGDVPTLELVN